MIAALVLAAALALDCAGGTCFGPWGWCGGAYSESYGTNFAPCPDWQRVSVEYQAGDGGGSTADAPAAAESAAPGPGTCK